MSVAETHQSEPVGVRFTCEACAEEAILALPLSRTRYGIVDCPACRATYLVALNGEDLDGDRGPGAGEPDGDGQGAALVPRRT